MSFINMYNLFSYVTFYELKNNIFRKTIGIRTFYCYVKMAVQKGKKVILYL